MEYKNTEFGFDQDDVVCPETVGASKGLHGHVEQYLIKTLSSQSFSHATHWILAPIHFPNNISVQIRSYNLPYHRHCVYSTNLM